MHGSRLGKTPPTVCHVASKTAFFINHLPRNSLSISLWVSQSCILFGNCRGLSWAILGRSSWFLVQRWVIGRRWSSSYCFTSFHGTYILLHLFGKCTIWLVWGRTKFTCMGGGGAGGEQSHHHRWWYHGPSPINANHWILFFPCRWHACIFALIAWKNVLLLRALCLCNFALGVHLGPTFDHCNPFDTLVISWFGM